ncbi:hypothetical protein H6F67_25725 [Microcoleus sp. FACHB-1515]|uniref:hypothetical protein n=1 Tax=Cyanophyceae TaxID=3028117 RepID=UPI0016898F46|nr:hypothetical protein [Microcoleus sp. FACHB-1515]MBD2093248.1 hypothetical protein [Microcoleus sp. FACHB-1515]
MLSPLYLAQALSDQAGGIPVTGGEQSALNIVTQSINIAKATTESWNSLWVMLFDPTLSGLWTGLVWLGLSLAALSIAYMALTTVREAVEKQSWADLVAIFVWPLVIALFLHSNGAFLAHTTIAIRNFGHSQVEKILDIQVGELSFRHAVSNIGISSTARQELENLYRECQGLVADELIECWNNKSDRAQEIIKAAQAAVSSPIRGMAELAVELSTVPGMISKAAELGSNAITFDYASTLSHNVVLPLIRLVLAATQWAFVNCLEATILLTALFGPIAIGLSILPLQGRPIWTWLTGLISLFGLQLGYNLLVGLVAVVIVKSGAELASDIAFLIFISWFAPILAGAVAGGGGLALYRGVANNAGRMAMFASDLVAAGARLAIKAYTAVG